MMERISTGTKLRAESSSSRARCEEPSDCRQQSSAEVRVATICLLWLGASGSKKMGDFDQNIEQCRQWRRQAIQRLQDFETGLKSFVDGKDVTEERKARERRIIEQMDALIPAYEAHNAERPA